MLCRLHIEVGDESNPQAALHGRREWEFDPVFWAIRLLARLGLAGDIVMPKSPQR